jgi:hypothetical protein
VVRRTELWNGNHERWSQLLSWDPERSIVRWAWTRHAHDRERYATIDARWSHVAVVRLSNPRETRAWLTQVPRR